MDQEREWLSKSWGRVLHELKHDGNSANKKFHCDVLIVGSGYGGAVAAAALGEANAAKQSVWLLERGNSYVPGEFPNQLAELPSHVRINTSTTLDTKGERQGLFDVRVNDDIHVLVANGLGGGSLINAGVMAWPEDDVFAQAPWPKAIRDGISDLHASREKIIKDLGAETWTDRHPANTTPIGAIPAKLLALEQLQRGCTHMASQFEAAPITINLMKDEEAVTDAGIALKPCKRCGDCATGCNVGAKKSLDTTLLAKAAQHGVKLITGATVLRIEPIGEGEVLQGWTIHVNHTEPRMQWGEGPAFMLKARKVILAAGTLGSTGILLRSEVLRQSKQKAPLFSRMLGTRFSSNGDMIASLYGLSPEINAIASEQQAADKRKIGPTITGLIRCKPDECPQTDDASTNASILTRKRTPIDRQFVVQDLAVPAALSRLYSELVATGHTMQQLDQVDLGPHAVMGDDRDPLAVDARQLRHTLPIGIMGHDSAQGRIALVKPEQSASRAAPTPCISTGCTLSRTAPSPSTGRSCAMTRASKRAWRICNA